ncbi:hypothetical protein V5799_034003 [Amblyomma americanum]|uniref:THAP-type domain-containing protein n=1 Tax=Amblyomma americanum TaxID=6943 RepID=A0AAQ4DLQ0_AMBAM
MSGSDDSNGSPLFDGRGRVWDSRRLIINRHAAATQVHIDGSLWERTKHSRICSNHFVNGEKSNDPRSPAYLPTLFLSEYRRTKTPSAYRYEMLWSREQSQEPTSSCVQEVATDEEGYDSTNGLISVETQTDPCTWTMEPDMPSLFLCCMQDCNAETQRPNFLKCGLGVGLCYLS